MVSINNRQCDLVTLQRDNYKGNKILETSKEVLGRRRKRRGKQLTESLGGNVNYRQETDQKVSVQNPLHSTNQSQRDHQIMITEMANNCSTTSITNNYNSYYKCKKELPSHVDTSSKSLPNRSHIQFKFSSYLRHLSNSPQMLLLVLFLMIHYASSLQLQASVSQNGVHGTITFTQSLSEGGGKKAVQISANFSVTDPSYAGEYSWGIYDFPIDYSRGPDSCHSRNLGRKPITNFDSVLNKLVIGMPEEEDHGSAFPTDPDSTPIDSEEPQEKASKKLSTLAALKGHESTHNSKKTFCCNYCGTNFS